MLAQFHNTRFYLVLAADFLVFMVAFIGAYLLRFDFVLEPFYQSQILRLLPFLLPGKVVIFFVFGLYRGMWRYTSRKDLGRLGQASLVSMFYYLIATSYIYGLQGVPRSVFLMDGLLTLILSGNLRLGIRFIYSRPFNKFISLQPSYLPNRSKREPKGKSILIIGAGDAGEKMCREILDNPALNYNLMGFLDDDRTKWGRSLHGVRVYGGVAMLPEVIAREQVDEVLIAIPSATGPQMRRISEICKSCGVPYRTLPDLGGIIDGKVSVKNLRDVKYEDLLRRPPVNLDTTEISRYLQGKKVLVTGAGGSIGSELCRQITRFEPAELILVEANEANLYGIQMELQHELHFPRYRCILSRVQNQPLMEHVFRSYQPELIFHAAAYKHVPMLEQNPWEAISNNVLGSQVVMELAVKYKVERFVLVSTDKAVRPTNIMGASKRLAELMVQALHGNGTRFMAVRFGNVIGSSGSVLPLFRRQLEQGGPITVTHPEVTRYFMTIPEAAQLILQAAGLGEGGEIFILEMGTPVKIAQMAEELVRLSGKEPGKDVQIVFTGLREGEKLFEELITQGEGIVATKHEKILVLRSNGDWNGRKTQSEFTQWLDKAVEELHHIAGTHDAVAIRGKLREILSEYIPQQQIKYILKSECCKSEQAAPDAALRNPRNPASDKVSPLVPSHLKFP
ncbi:MAG: polysaccharide biosynthesis protein [Deltaproteobacteria bacterium]|nr:polysaccharide biosynthesis protein [Deltaproteobacteria bacterium]